MDFEVIVQCLHLIPLCSVNQAFGVSQLIYVWLEFQVKQVAHCYPHCLLPFGTFAFHRAALRLSKCIGWLKYDALQFGWCILLLVKSCIAIRPSLMDPQRQSLQQLPYLPSTTSWQELCRFVKLVVLDSKRYRRSWMRSNRVSQVEETQERLAQSRHRKAPCCGASRMSYT